MDGKGGPYYPFNAIKLVLFVSPTSDSKEVLKFGPHKREWKSSFRGRTIFDHILLCVFVAPNLAW